MHLLPQSFFFTPFSLLSPSLPLPFFFLCSLTVSSSHFALDPFPHFFSPFIPYDIYSPFLSLSAPFSPFLIYFCYFILFFFFLSIFVVVVLFCFKSRMTSNQFTILKDSLRKQHPVLTSTNKSFVREYKI